MGENLLLKKKVIITEKESDNSNVRNGVDRAYSFGSNDGIFDEGFARDFIHHTQSPPPEASNRIDKLDSL